MEPISLDWVCTAIKAQTNAVPGLPASSVSTDTRNIAPGALFFALNGEHFDGHAYVKQAFANGAIGAVVSRDIPGASGPLLIVGNTLTALGDLAMHYRRRFDIPIVGVTGSVGKTSTKEMIAAVLNTRYRTLASEKNYNNEIGVSLTLLALTPEHQAAVIEMGMRGPGQIDRLAEIAQPTVGVVTNIGFTHIELLHSRDNIAAAKAELLARLPQNGTAVLPLDDHYYEYLRSRVPNGCTLLTFGLSKANLQGEPPSFNLRAHGAHHIVNAKAALAVAQALEVPVQQAVQALETWEGAAGRMEVHETSSGWTVLDDCYNASPESMQAALSTLAEMALARKVAILGDMKELGDFGPHLHREIARAVHEAGIGLLVTVGDLAQLYASTERMESPGNVQTINFKDAFEAAASIQSILCPGDTILVKGSRAMQMEVISQVLIREYGANSHG